MTTDPYSSDTPALLTRSLSHVVAGRIVLPTETITLDVQGGRLSFDETRSPRVMLTGLECRIPTDPAVLSRIDPRTGARVELDLGYTRPGGAQDVHLIADLGLRTRPVARPADTMTLEAASDEALVIDGSPTVGAAFSTANTTTAIRDVLRAVFPALTPTVTAGVGPAIAQGPYDDRWDLVLDLSDRIGARTFDDGLRGWHIDPVPVLGTPNLDLSVGANGTIVDSEAGLGRDEWANVVILRYRWRDTSDVEHTITATRRVQTGPYAATVGNSKIELVERDVATTQTEANAAAAALVARTVTRGRSLTVTAVSAYWLRPGDTVNVTLPTGPTEQHLVASVDFDLATGLMQVTTRLPDNTGTIGA